MRIGMYHFSVRVTLLKKGNQSGKEERMYLQGIHLYLRTIDSPSEQFDLSRLKSNGRLQFQEGEHFQCLPQKCAREAITLIINCKELTGYQANQNCITFSIGVIQKPTGLQRCDQQSDLVAERMLAKYQDLNIIDIGWKFVIVNGVSQGLNWMRLIGGLR
ncbi:hypothetical protein FGO68_gene8643 [Halteria grandinella]|uniref:Uncharacterized protein n=1 Tax=Halteria grandinella TaxID=5974 RepID=A0A8J8SZQ4_HALGN|nr:hypothetical protein FGO68_gene8643 [Halteria grandinella]